MSAGGLFDDPAKPPGCTCPESHYRAGVHLRQCPEFVQRAQGAPDVEQLERTVIREPHENAGDLARVTSKLGDRVLAFMRAHAGREFTMAQLTKAVDEGAPGSAGRILRNLRQQGLVDYVVVNRSSSTYRCTSAPIDAKDVGAAPPALGGRGGLGRPLHTGYDSHDAPPATGATR